MLHVLWRFLKSKLVSDVAHGPSLLSPIIGFSWENNQVVSRCLPESMPLTLLVGSSAFGGGFSPPKISLYEYLEVNSAGEHHSEISGRSLSECLDECLRQPSFQCRSAEYSERYRTCRLTRYNQRDGMRIIYDADYDYYENLMLGGEGEGSGSRPGEGYPGGGNRYPATGGRYPVTSGSRYPPPSGGGGGEYDDRLPARRPTYSDRYPDDDRYPTRPDRYPVGPARYPPASRYPQDDRERYPVYPPSSGGALYPRPRPSYGGNSRYPDGERYGSRYGDRYDYRHDSLYGDRMGDRDRFYAIDRYPPGVADRYGYSDRDRYSGDRGRYPTSGGYGGRFEGDDRFTSRYGGSGTRYGNRYNDRYSGSRFGAGGSGTRYDTNRYDYYGDDRDGDGRWFSRPDRRPLGRPVEGRPPYDRPERPERPGYEDRPYAPNRRPYSPGPDGPIYDSFNSIAPGRPFNTRCEEGDNFKQMGTRQRARKEFVRRTVFAPSLSRCQQECIEERAFLCRAFNYKESPSSGGYENDRENCELSDRDSSELEMGNAQFFDSNGNYDFYERAIGRIGGDDDCLDVSQVCNEDGMEFTLRTPEGFFGRIYSYGFYDRCFFRGNGGTVNVLRISGAQGYPECGTQRYGDTMTNIVVVQFSDFVQTGKDKRFNLTCLFRGPGEAVVSSGFIGAGSGSPIPIEYLPAENTLSSKVRLMILYQGRPTTTIAVGDPLTFRLEAQDGYNYVTDIFATNVVARDPYSGRSVQLIDRFGCPVDSFVFPELDKGRSGDSLEARFNAFKIPESNFLVFEATVRTCREGCQPAYCQSGTGRSEPSFGRRKRSLNETHAENATSHQLPTPQSLKAERASTEAPKPQQVIIPSKDSTVSFLKTDLEPKRAQDGTMKVTSADKSSEEEPEFVREMIEVFDSREEMPQARIAEPAPDVVCLRPGEYHGLIGAVFVLVAILLTASLLAGLAYRKYWLVMRKNMIADRISSSNFSSAPSYPTTRSSAGLSQGVSAFGTMIQKPFSNFSVARATNFPIIPKVPDHFDSPGSAPGGPFEDPSEPIYTDPSLFERSRSLRSIAVSAKRRISSDRQ